MKLKLFIIATSFFLPLLVTTPAFADTSITVSTVTLSPSPVQVNSPITATATFTDTDSTAIHTATVNWGDTGHSADPCNITEPNGSTPGSVTCTRSAGYSTDIFWPVSITVSNGTLQTTSAFTFVFPYNTLFHVSNVVFTSAVPWNSTYSTLTFDTDVDFGPTTTTLDAPASLYISSGPGDTGTEYMMADELHNNIFSCSNLHCTARIWYTHLNFINNTDVYYGPTFEDTSFTATTPFYMTVINDAGLIYDSSNSFSSVQFLQPTSKPIPGAVTVSPNPAQINTAVTATTTYTDADPTVTHTAKVDWDGSGTLYDCAVTEPNGTTPGTVNCSLPSGYSTANIYAVTIYVYNSNGNQGQSTNPYVSVFAPTPSGKFSAGEGFVTPAGTYAQSPAVSSGTVQFGLVYKYNGTMPSGQKTFTMTFGSPNNTFSAASVTSLVISNGIGTITGTGTFSGSNTVYNFLVTGDQNNNTIRIKITDPNNNNAVIYDTQPGASDTADPTTPVTGPNGKGNGHVIAG